MKRFRRMIAILCSVSMLLCVIPTTVFASAEEVTGATALEEPIDTSAVDYTLDINDLTAEDIVGEDESLRDATTKHYQLTDGTMIAVSYPIAVHEQVDGKWVNIDNTLSDETSADGDAVMQTAANNIRFSFVKGKGNGRLMKVEDTASKAEVIFELQNANKKELVMTQTTSSDELFMLDNVMQKGTYTNIIDGVDIEYIVAGDMLKENIIVKKVAAMKPFTFLLRCKNLTATLQADHSVLLADTEGNVVFTIPAPFMVDATGATSDQVFVTLNACDKGYYYTMTPSSIWTSDPERVYPITIDPVVQSNWDPTEIHGAYIKESNPDVPVGDDQYMWVGELGSSSGNTCYGLLKFDLPTIRACDYVIGSVMNLCPSDLSDYITYDSGWSSWNSNYLDGSMILEAHAITAPWNEQTVTWNNRPSFDSSIMDAVALVSKHSIRNEDCCRTVINVTEIAKEWYNGGNNYGVLFKLNNEGTHPFAAEYCTDLWAMSEANDIMQAQPVIQVQYRSKAGLENVYSYASVSAGEAGTGYAQLNSGNLTFIHDGLSLGGTEPTVAIKHVYNTCNNQTNSGYGFGWTLNYAQTLEYIELGERKYYAYTDADATVHYFEVTETKSEYEDESGLELKLKLDTSSHHTIEDKNGNQWLFYPNADGRLFKIVSTYGRRILVEYDSGKIIRITDGLDRVYTFTYANNMLESITSPDGRQIGYNYTALNLTSIRASKNGAVYEDNVYTYDDNRVLKTAQDKAGYHAEFSCSGSGSAARMTKLRGRFFNTATAGYTHLIQNIAYDTHQTTVTDGDGRTVTYQFDVYGLTRCIYNNNGQAQYFRYYAPNAQNENGTDTYGPNKLEASSQTQWSAQNLLKDPSFEWGGAWTGDGTRAATSTCYEGSYTWVYPNHYPTDSKTAVQSVTLTKGATYTASAYVYTGSTTVRMFADSGAGTSVYGETTISKADGWKRIQFTFTVPTTASTDSVRIGFQVTNQGTAWIDCVQLEKTTTANRYNLLENGDFNTYGSNNAYPDRWSLSIGSAGTIAGVVSGPSAPSALGLSARCYTTYPAQLADASSSVVKSNATLSQTVTVKDGKVGTTFSYGMWMQGDSLPDAFEGEEDDVAFGITVKLFNGDTEVQTQSTPANRFCEAWQFVGDVIVAKKAFTKVQILLEYQNNCNRCYFDGAYIYRDYFGQSYAYDDDGNVISTTAYADQKSTFEYSASDDLLSSVSPEGAEFTYTYNNFHDVKTGTSAEGVRYAYRYDEVKTSLEAGTVQAAQTVLGTAMNTATVDVEYDETTHHLTWQKTTDARGQETITYYNDNGTVNRTVDATGITTAYTYDTRYRNTKVVATDQTGAVLSTVEYVYDTHDRLTEIQNGDVRYFFTYDAQGRTAKVSVGTSSGNAVILSQTSYIDKTGNGYHSTQVDTQSYGNGDKKIYRYDSRGRVTGVKYEDDTNWHYTYTYDAEGNLVAVTDHATGETVRYEYDLSKRLSRIIQSDGYTLTYEYNDDNALVGVKESGNGVANSTRYVYNKDNVLTQMISPTDSTVDYDYSYNRRADRYYETALYTNADTYGFAPVSGATITECETVMGPVADEMTVEITRTATAVEITNFNAMRARNMREGHRYVLSYWYQAKAGTTGTLDATLKFNVSNTVSPTQETVSTTINADGNWHYVECLLTATGDLYSSKGDYVTPTLSWNGSGTTGTVYLNGISFAEEYDTVMFATDLKKAPIQSAGTTITDVTDNSAPVPTVLRKWEKSGGTTQSISHRAGELFTTTPQPGEIWEFTFDAKLVSGSQGNGFMVSFRAESADNAAVSNEETIMLETDGEWHTYTRYVTIAENAYDSCKRITPYFGWVNSTDAGVVLVGGVTVRKVGNQWNNNLPNMGFAPAPNNQTVMEEVDSTDSPIAYQKTVHAAHTGPQYQYTLSAPLSSFPQPTATDKWTLSFWAKTDGDSTVALYKRTQNSGTPQGTALIKDGEWHYYTFPLNLGDGFDLTDISLYYTISPQTELYLNGINLVPGTVALANESGQNSAALKNITVNTGTTKFNTAIEYDTDANNTAYSRVKHYINNGEAYSYTYDEAGNISKIQNPDGSYVEYTYDSLNQLTREYHSLPCVKGGAEGEAEAEGLSYDTIKYTYDTRGNILSKTYSLDNTVVDTITYGYTDTTWKDRLTSYNGVTITADEIGNPLNWINGETLTWQRGRQLASHTKNGVTSSYTYNDEGIRTSKTVGNVTTTYSVVDGTLRRLTDGTNTLQFIYGNGLSSVIFNGTEYWYVFNAQGDIIGLIDASGNYVVEYTYDSWGKILSQTDSELARLNPFRYRGYIYDEETGFYLTGTRYYDPEIGRFINADNQISGVGSDIRGYNLFAYCFNNPVNMSDPTGNWPRWITATVAAVATVVAVVATVVSAPVVATAAAAVAVVSTVAYVAQSHHYDKRKAKNTNLPKTPQEADDLNWKNSNPKSDINPNGGGPAADCHQYTSPDKSNVKFVSPDGHREVIYNSQNEIVLDARDIGTYNYSPSGSFWGSIGHFFADMLPWYLFGNDDDDPGPLANEIIRLFE